MVDKQFKRWIWWKTISSNWTWSRLLANWRMGQSEGRKGNQYLHRSVNTEEKKWFVCQIRSKHLWKGTVENNSVTREKGCSCTLIQTTKTWEEDVDVPSQFASWVSGFFSNFAQAKRKWLIITFWKVVLTFWWILSSSIDGWRTFPLGMETVIMFAWRTYIVKEL